MNPPFAIALFSMVLTLSAALAGAAGAWTRHRGIRLPPGGTTAVIAALAFAAAWSPAGFLLAHAGIFLVIAVGTAMTRPALPWAAQWIGYGAVSALSARYLAWRDLAAGLSPTEILQYVLHDFVSQAVLAPLFALAGDFVPPALWSAWSEMVGVLLQGAHAALPLFMTTAIWLVVWVVLAAAKLTDTPPDRRFIPHAWFHLVPAIVLVAVVTTDLPGWALAVVAPPYLVTGGVHLHAAAGGLRSRTLVVAVLFSLAAFVPVIGWAIGGFGYLAALTLPGPNRARWVVSPGQVALAALATGAVLMTLGAFTRRVTNPLSQPPAQALQQCDDTTVSRQSDTVTYSGAHNFSVEIEERPFVSMAQAKQACAATGQHLCTSAELFAACLCGHRNEQDADTLGSFQINRPLQQRARRECIPVHHDETPGDCLSDHGVHDLLGGRTEVTADGFGGVRLMAGPNVVLQEDWMIDCTYRGLMPASLLDTAQFEFVGYRCCGD